VLVKIGSWEGEGGGADVVPAAALGGGPEERNEVDTGREL
jgi:hypothetical protein